MCEGNKENLKQDQEKEEEKRRVEKEEEEAKKKENAHKMDIDNVEGNAENNDNFSDFNFDDDSSKKVTPLSLGLFFFSGG